MRKEIREKIFEDYKEASNLIRAISSGKRPNATVLGRQYLCPTIVMETSLKLDDMYGELIYFKEIRDCLKDILTYGKTSKKIFNPPEYIQEFIKE